jgi:hypothetical protein
VLAAPKLARQLMAFGSRAGAARADPSRRRAPGEADTTCSAALPANIPLDYDWKSALGRLLGRPLATRLAAAQLVINARDGCRTWPLV